MLITCGDSYQVQDKDSNVLDDDRFFGKHVRFGGVSRDGKDSWPPLADEDYSTHGPLAVSNFRSSRWGGRERLQQLSFLIQQKELGAHFPSG